jgi:hypothetical protein
VSAVVHGLGLGAALLLMREGTPLVPLADRLEYLREHAARWQLGWAVWIGCAVALLSFAAVLARRIRSPLGWVALGTMGMAAAIDLGCDVLYVTAFLEAARGAEADFLALERALGFASVTIGNGLYTLGVLIFTLALRGEVLPRFTRAAAAGCVVAGTLMAIAGVFGSAEGLAAATGPTIALFAAWSILVARGLERS